MTINGKHSAELVLGVHERGIALVVVLWMLVIITIIAASYSQTIRTEMMLATNIQNQAKALSLAEQGVWRGAMLALEHTANSEHYQLDELDGQIYSLQADKGELKISLQSTNGLIDLNRAPEEVLKHFFQYMTENELLAQEITDSILDWRDEDDNVRTFGAESADYAHLGYTAKNGVMNSADELGLVKGMSQALLEKVLPYVTIYSGQPRVAIATAPRTVLMSLPGISSDRGEAILSSRRSGVDAEYLSFVPQETKRYIGSGTDEIIRISSLGNVNHARVGIVAVVKLTPSGYSPVTVLSWRERIAPVFEENEK